MCDLVCDWVSAEKWNLQWTRNRTRNFTCTQIAWSCTCKPPLPSQRLLPCILIFLEQTNILTSRETLLWNCTRRRAKTRFCPLDKTTLFIIVLLLFLYHHFYFFLQTVPRLLEYHQDLSTPRATPPPWLLTRPWTSRWRPSSRGQNCPAIKIRSVYKCLGSNIHFTFRISS